MKAFSQLSTTGKLGADDVTFSYTEKFQAVSQPAYPIKSLIKY